MKEKREPSDKPILKWTINLQQRSKKNKMEKD